MFSDAVMQMTRSSVPWKIRTTLAVGLMVLGVCCCDSGRAENQNSSDVYNFGIHDIGSKSAPITITLKNPTNSKVKFVISPNKDSKPDYQLEKNGCSDEIGASASCVIEVTFAPMGDGERSAQWNVNYQGGAEQKPLTLGLLSFRGIGFLPDLSVSSTQIFFSVPSISAVSPPQTIRISNNSSGEIRVTEIVINGDFVLERPSLPQSLKAKDSIILAVTFKPTHEGNSPGSITISGDGKGTSQNVLLLGTVSGSLNELCLSSPCTEILLMLALCLVYWLAMVVVRWNRVARPTRELLKAEIKSLTAELDILTTKDKSVEREKIGSLLDAAGSLIDNVNDPWLKRLANILFWSRGQELTGWGYLHEAEVHMTPFLPTETVTARIETNEQKLRMANDAPTLALANAIHQELTSPSIPINCDRRKALLAEALNSIYQREDSSFADLVSWQNKTSWLVACGLVLILVLTGAIHNHSILFLVGATGGLLSRLSRSLDRKDVPTDYGASWTTLFLSPVAGALGAWAGILLSDLAVKLNVLGPVFQVDWSNAPCHPTTLAIALVFGFSERLFDGVLDKLTDKTGTTQVTATNPQPPQKTTAAGPTITATDQTLPVGKVGSDYSAQLQVPGIAGGATWSLAIGSALPQGLNLTSDGKITGKPTTAGTTTFSADIVSQGVKQSGKRFTITVSP